MPLIEARQEKTKEFQTKLLHIFFKSNHHHYADKTRLHMSHLRSSCWQRLSTCDITCQYMRRDLFNTHDMTNTHMLF